MKYLLLLLFSLPLTAQVKESQVGGIKDIGRISDKAPLYIIDGEKVSESLLKTKQLKTSDIAKMLLFSEPIAKRLFGSSAKYGAIYVITKETFRKAKALANNPPNRQLNKEEQLYAEIWEFYQTYRLIVVSGKVTDKEGKPLANIRVYNKDRNTETYTDSLGNYTIKADRWDMLMVHCCTSCKMITDEEKEQEINFEGAFEGTYKEAEKWYIKAAEQKSFIAIKNLLMFYDNEKNKKEIKKWILKIKNEAGLKDYNIEEKEYIEKLIKNYNIKL